MALFLALSARTATDERTCQYGGSDITAADAWLEAVQLRGDITGLDVAFNVMAGGEARILERRADGVRIPELISDARSWLREHRAYG